MYLGRNKKFGNLDLWRTNIKRHTLFPLLFIYSHVTRIEKTIKFWWNCWAARFSKIDLVLGQRIYLGRLSYGRSACIIGKPQKDIFDTIFISPIEKSKVGRQARKLHSSNFQRLSKIWGSKKTILFSCATIKVQFYLWQF